jgi:cytochrome bd-type quinol oxidase subunit 2
MEEQESKLRKYTTATFIITGVLVFIYFIFRRLVEDIKESTWTVAILFTISVIISTIIIVRGDKTDKKSFFSKVYLIACCSISGFLAFYYVIIPLGKMVLQLMGFSGFHIKPLFSF